MPLRSKVLTRIIDGMAVPLFIIDPSHRITHWNKALEVLSGKNQADVVGTDIQKTVFYQGKRPTLADLIVDDEPPDMIARYYQDKAKRSVLIEGAYEAQDFFPALGQNGTWILFTASRIVDDTGSTVGAIETLLDISQRIYLEDNLRFYIQQITQMHENERMRLARELHDELSQIVGSASREVDNLLRKKSTLGSQELVALQEIRLLLAEGSKAMNIMIKNLRPSLLDDLGLIPALRSLATNLEETEGIVTTFSIEGEETRLDSESELSIFRIVQESLNNVRKHAQAAKVNVRVFFDKDGVTIIVEDNGIGFQLPISMDRLPRSGKLGLMGMQERVWLLSGSIDVSSSPGEGTSLTFRIPTKT